MRICSGKGRERLRFRKMVEGFYFSVVLLDFFANLMQMSARNATLSLKELNSPSVPWKISLGSQKRLECTQIDVVAFKGGHKRLQA